MVAHGRALLPIAGAAGSIPGRGTKSPNTSAVWQKKEERKKKNPQGYSERNLEVGAPISWVRWLGEPREEQRTKAWPTPLQMVTGP